MKNSVYKVLLLLITFFQFMVCVFYPDQAVAKNMSLEECINTAIDNNYLLSSEKGKVDSSLSRVKVAESGLNPTIEANGNYEIFTEDRRLSQATYEGQRGYYDDQEFQSDISISVPISTGGRVKNEIESASNLYLSQQENFKRTKQNIAYQVSQIYYSILATEESIAYLMSSKKFLESHYSVIEKQVEVGRAASIDLTRIGVELSSIEQQLIKTRGEVKLQHLDLAQVMGISYSGNSFTISEKMEPQTPPLPLEDLISMALDSRPDLKASVFAVTAAEHAVKVADALDNPNVFLKGSVVYQSNSQGQDESSGFIGLDVQIPMWDGGVSSARMQEAEGEKTTAYYIQQDLISRVSLDVEKAYTDMVTTYERVGVSRKALESAKESLRIEMLKHEMGKGTVTDVLSAQSSLLNAESNFAIALAENNIADSRLSLALGAVNYE